MPAQRGTAQQRVERFLRSHRHEDSFLDAEVTTDQPIAATVGTVIGPYMLLEQIGEGWVRRGVQGRAERAVALAPKVLKPGMDTRQVVGRFAKFTGQERVE